MRIVPQREPYEKLNLVRDLIAIAKWRARQKPECMICGADGLDLLNRLQVHHIAGAAGRSDEDANLLLICRLCHEDVHAYRLTLEEVLAAKQLCDPERYDRERVMILKGFSKEALTRE